MIEIGPGRGALTIPLAPHVAQVVAIEVDRDLAGALERQAIANLRVLAADILRVDLKALMASEPGIQGDGRLRVLGNLPYNITSPVLFWLFDHVRAGMAVLDATLMVQREVADRLTAQPGTRDYGVLTIMAALHASVTPILALPPGAFRPAPAVHSAVVRFSFRPLPAETGDLAILTAMVRSMFTQRRKTLANALAPFAASRGTTAAHVLRAAQLDPRSRPETLDLPAIARLANVLGAHLGG